ncbi:trafficking protein particle complex subunit 12 [Phialemonium atrogriseum]|uniref:Trafficking protein particle complex subunit 12 n=1 Tax=Phialemonium atrogriseum TaxID=1093897 RepID=A0AAJ0FQN5_9PEZI|nr:trafficking protein particle complex subunit 12 [Phialemonium atrogriseum]KAK1771449.1 trafficking protein particle complex subunit 12 [Phialemonium atrogriseum]
MGGPLLSPAAPPSVPEQRDLSHLLRPETYQPLSQLSIPAPFRNSPRQPRPDTAIPDLLARGHYRAAAIAAAQELSGTGGAPPPDPADHARILDLIHVRLACLGLSAASGVAVGVAAQEARALGDVVGPSFFSSSTTTTSDANDAADDEEPPWPWPLRVLAVRLQALGFADPRRAVASYYELAAEARSRLRGATARGDNSARELWRGRLAGLGVAVAGALVEMGDLAGAARHLETLRGGVSDGGAAMVGFARALLWLHVGDVEAARACVGPGEVGEKIVAALCAMADGEYGEALAAWRELRAERPEDEMIGVNMAVCLLYVGEIQEGKSLLEGMVDAGYSSHTLLFNLATMYELCTERSRTLKAQLAERVAGMEESPMGWEKGNADFKL